MMSLVYRLNRCLAFLAGDFTDKFRHEVAGELGADLCDEFAGAFVANFEVRDSFCMVELVQVVGEDALLE